MIWCSQEFPKRSGENWVYSSKTIVFQTWQTLLAAKSSLRFRFFRFGKGHKVDHFPNTILVRFENIHTLSFFFQNRLAVFCNCQKPGDSSDSKIAFAINSQQFEAVSVFLGFIRKELLKSLPHRLPIFGWNTLMVSLYVFGKKSAGSFKISPVECLGPIRKSFLNSLKIRINRCSTDCGAT